MAGTAGDSGPRPAPDERVKRIDEILRANPELQRQIEESLAYFDRGEPGIPWEEVQRRARARRNEQAV